MNEPQGSPGWYPANDNPRDKATYDFEITVPEGITAIATAAWSRARRVAARPRGAGGRTRRWRPTSPRRPTGCSTCESTTTGSCRSITPSIRKWATRTAAQQAFLDAYNGRPATSSFWRTPPAALPGPRVMFSSPPYDRGGMTLQALREKIGDDAFFTVLRRWYAENLHGNVTTADFIALSERVSGQDLDAFFDVWLYQPVKPTSW